jgi:AraC family transcriptional regulator
VNNDSFWETRLSQLTYSYESRRQSFYHTTETIGYWIWLALESGRFSYKIGRGKNALEGQCGPGDWIICPPNEPFQREMIEDCAFHYARFKCVGNGLYALRGGGTLRNMERLRANFTSLKATRKASSNPEWTSHLVLDVFRHAYQEQQAEDRYETEDDAMQKAREWLEAHYHEKISLESIASGMRLTPSAFSHRFRAAVGASPMEFLQAKRFDMARQLLLETNLTIDAVAKQSGFATGFYFSRLWTKRYGVAPARFRRSHRI